MHDIILKAPWAQRERTMLNLNLNVNNFIQSDGYKVTEIQLRDDIK